MIKSYEKRQGFLPAAMLLLYKDQITTDDFCCRCPYCIHSLHPKHLIFGFERFHDTFLFSELLYQSKEHILRLRIQICKVTVEFTSEKQAVIQSLAILADIPQMSLSPYADGLLFFFRNCQTGNVIIALQFIPKAVVFIINVLVYIQNPPYN